MSLPAHSVRFGPFVLDLHAAELEHNGTKTRLPEQLFQIIVALTERPGEVVTREELRQRLWGSDTFVDFEHGLNTAIKRLRETLGDSAEHPQYVETLPRHGYRFLVPVERSKSADAGNGARRKYRRLAAAACVVAIAIGLIWLWPTRIKSLAVMPLENLTGTSENERLADDMTNALIAELGKIGRLRVASARSVLPYKGTNKTVPRVAGELHVDTVLEGQVLRTDEKVYVTVHLQAKGGRSLWSHSYERDLGEASELAREVARDIARLRRVGPSVLGVAKEHASR